MTTLVTDINLPDPDGFYERLIAMHHGLPDAESALVNARLVLLLANHIGDPAVLAQAMAAARGAAAASPQKVNPNSGDMR